MDEEAIRKAMVELVSTSSDGLKEAYKSQRILAKKIKDLQENLIQIRKLGNVPNFNDFYIVLNHLKSRLEVINKKIENLQKRFLNIEENVASGCQVL